jgi:Lon protease-like protein
MSLPSTLSIFPLEGALLLPHGELPLNIFEPRYLAMVRTAIAGDRLIGMVQPCPCPDKIVAGARPFYEVGCAGRISSFEETADGRFLITLRGLARFRISAHELHAEGYRLATVDFADFAGDLAPPQPLPECLVRSTLIEKIEEYMENEGLSLDWDLAAKVPDQRFYTLLEMVCPFTPAEKQALLEAPNFEERCRLMKCLLDMACAEEKHDGHKKC